VADPCEYFLWPWYRLWEFYKQKCVVCFIMCLYIYIYIYTGGPRRNVPDFGRVFLMLNYTDITQNTCVQSRTVTEIMAREKCGRHRCRNTVSRP